VRSHGVEGLFHRAKDNPYIVIKKSVNNLGDIRWIVTYDTRSGTRDHAFAFSTRGSHDLLRNYAEGENWFKETHPRV
jgi:hypothetical protein